MVYDNADGVFAPLGDLIKHKPDRSDINKLEGWVDRGLEIHNARFIRYGLTQGAGSVEVNKTCPNPGAG